MADLREFLRYLVGGGLCLAVLMISAIAWIGMSVQFGAWLALAALVAGALLGVNFAFVIGSFCFFYAVWSWPPLTALAAAAPAIWLVWPSRLGRLFGVSIPDGLLPWWLQRALERRASPPQAGLAAPRAR